MRASVFQSRSPKLLKLATASSLALALAACSAASERFSAGNPFENPFSSRSDPQSTASIPRDPAMSAPRATITSQPLPAPGTPSGTYGSSAPPAPVYSPPTAQAPYQPPRAPQYRVSRGADPVNTGSLQPPRANAPAAPRASSGTHVVAPGETLYSIARLYGTGPVALATANGLSPDTRLRLGQRISVPSHARAAAAPKAQPPQVVRAAATAPAPKPAVAAAAPARPPQQVAAIPKPAAPKVEAVEQETTGSTGSASNTDVSFRWPARGRVISGFGSKPNGTTNDGINLAVPEGTPIRASESGVVAYAGNELKGYGNLVLVRHPGGWVTAYAHASEISVRRGDTVRRGQIIGKSGKSGNVNAPQLHFEVRRGATPVDPMQHLPNG